MPRWPWLLLPLLVTCAHRPWEDPGPHWQRLTSQHFAVDTDSDPATCLPLIDRLEDIHAALSRTFFQGLEIPRVRVLLFESARDFKTLVPGENIAGFFHGAPDGGVLVFSAQAAGFDQVASIAAHELAHRFMHTLAPAVPAWLNEGFAKYVDAIELKDDLIVFDASAALSRAYHASLVPLSQVFAATNRDYHADDGRYYMTSWRIVRQLFGNSGPGATERFRTLVERATAAGSPDQQAAAVSAALGLPIAEIEARIRSDHQRAQWGVAQTESRRTLAVTLQRSPHSPPQVTSLDAGEVRALCREIKGLVPPPVVPDPRDQCFVGQVGPQDLPDAGAPVNQASPAASLSPEMEQILLVIRGHIRAVKACFLRAQAQKPDLAGRVVVRFTIASDGTIARSAVASSTLAHAGMETCLGQEICRWTFPRPEPEGRIVVVDYPLVFQRGGAP